MGPSWIDQAREVSVPNVAAALGLRVDRRGRTLHPCPAPDCGAEQRGSVDRRGPVEVRHQGRGWCCYRCGAKGDALNLVARVLHHAPKLSDLDAEQKADVRAWYASHGWCDDADGPPRAVRAPKPIARRTEPDAPPARPDAREVTDLWGACTRVTEDDDVARWIALRGLDPDRVAARDLARALPVDLDVPGWARFMGTPWSRGSWRCIFPAYGPTGRVESLRARSIDPNCPKGQKAAAAGAGPGSATGIVLADGAGREVLSTGSAPRWWPTDAPLVVVVTEGEPDFLTWATRFGDAADDAPVVLGLFSGSWTAKVAARIPDSARVAVRTDADEVGDHYAWATVWASLAPRLGKGSVLRPRKPADKDDNDLLQAGLLPLDPFGDVDDAR